MSTLTTLSEQRDELKFVEEAAAYFKKNPQASTYARTHNPGSFIALRWGLMDRSVRVLKLADDFPPVTYADAIV